MILLRVELSARLSFKSKGDREKFPACLEPVSCSITVRDLLTFGSGYGAVMALPGRYRIQKAMQETGIAPQRDYPMTLI
jgi:hypothetical protein